MTEQIPLTSTFTAAEGVMSTEVDDEVVLLDVSSGKYFALNELGAFVWQHLDGSRTLEAVQEAILATYDVDPETSRRDLTALFQDLLARGLVVRRDAAPTSG